MGGPNGPSLYAYNQWAGSFSNLYGYLFQGGSIPSGGWVTVMFYNTYVLGPPGDNTLDDRSNALIQAMRNVQGLKAFTLAVRGGSGFCHCAAG